MPWTGGGGHRRMHLMPRCSDRPSIKLSAPGSEDPEQQAGTRRSTPREPVHLPGRRCRPRHRQLRVRMVSSFTWNGLSVLVDRFMNEWKKSPKYTRIVWGPSNLQVFPRPSTVLGDWLRFPGCHASWGPLPNAICLRQEYGRARSGNHSLRPPGRRITISGRAAISPA